MVPICKFHKNIPCNDTLLPGTEVTFRCKNGFEENGDQPKIFCREDGTWEHYNATYLNHFCTLKCGEPDKYGLTRNAPYISPEERPWTVPIYFQNISHNNYKQICGGVLIRHNLVLTAAHCVCDNEDKKYDAHLFRVGAPNSVDNIINRDFGWTVMAIKVNS